MADDILPFLNEAMDSFVVKIYVLRSKEIIKGTLDFFLGFQGFISKGTTEGTGRGGDLIGQSLGNMGVAVRPATLGIRGFHWSHSLCGVSRCREGGTAGIATSSFPKVGATSPSQWSIGGSKCPH